MKKILFALPFIAALTACGGGGGGGGSSPTQNKTIPDETVIENKPVGENTTVVKTLPSGSSSNLKYTIKNNSNSTSSTSDTSYDWLNVEIDSDSVIFNIGDVNRPYDLILEFRNKDSGEIVFKIPLFVNNSSAKELTDQVGIAISQSDSLLALENEKKIYFYIVDLLYLSNNSVSYSDKQSYLEKFNVREFSTYQGFSDAINNLKDGLENYNKGEGGVTDSVLESHLENFEKTLLAHGRMASGMIEFLQYDVNSTGVVELPNTDVNYIKTQEIYSRFIGNSEYGQWVNGNWVYKPDFDFLKNIVNVETSGTCSI